MRNFARLILSAIDILIFYRKTFWTIVLCAAVGVTLPYLLSGLSDRRWSFLGIMRFVLTTLRLPRWLG